MSLYIKRTEINNSEAIKEIRKLFPNTLYKFRSFKSDYSKPSLENSLLYFASPKVLNDEYDIRLPIEIDYAEVESPKFIERLKIITQRIYPNLNPTSYEFISKVNDKYFEIKKDPIAYFEKNIKGVRDGEIYEEFGILSLTSDCLNDKMWGYYGDSNEGFCVGYDTVKLYELGAGSFGKVIYSDVPLKFSLIEKMADDFDVRSCFQKSKQWKHEKEYRFVNYLEFLKTRLKSIPFNIVNEVVLGSQISTANKDFIIRTLVGQYNSIPKLYKIKKSLSSFKLEKDEIIY